MSEVLADVWTLFQAHPITMGVLAGILVVMAIIAGAILWRD